MIPEHRVQRIVRHALGRQIIEPLLEMAIRKGGLGLAIVRRVNEEGSRRRVLGRMRVKELDEMQMGRPVRHFGQLDS